MTAPRFVDCRCGHPKFTHETEGFAPQCTTPRCECLSYRPGFTPTAAATLAAVQPQQRPSNAEQLLTAGKQSYAKRTVALAEKIQALLDDMWARLQDEHATTAARREVEELEAKLAEAKARLRGERTATAATAPTVECPDCGKTVKPTGLGIHRAKAHGPKAVAS